MTKNDISFILVGTLLPAIEEGYLHTILLIN